MSTQGDNTSYTVKEYLSNMSEQLNRRLDRIEDKLDSKADSTDLSLLTTRVSKIELTALNEAELTALRRADLIKLVDRVQLISDEALTIDNVKEIIAQALQDSAARGWTNRERLMGIVLFLVTLASFVLNLLASGGV